MAELDAGQQKELPPDAPQHWPGVPRNAREQSPPGEQQSSHGVLKVPPLYGGGGGDGLGGLGEGGGGRRSSERGGKGRGDVEGAAQRAMAAGGDGP